MGWTERQQQLLEAMGLRVWTPPVAEAAEGGEAVEIASAPPRRVAEPAAVAAPVVPAAPSVPTVPSGPLGALGWAELRDAVAACRACSLCEKRTQTVFGVGHQRAAWMLVGEAPGEQEDREGEPFVGAAGQLLDRMLAALQLTRATDGQARPEQRVYIANRLKCKPPGHRVPKPEEFATCEPFLVRQVELIRPKLIVATGRFAGQALLRSDEPFARLRGRVHRFHGVPLVVTYDPDYLLRNPAEKAKAWDDLCFAAEVFEQQGVG